MLTWSVEHNVVSCTSIHRNLRFIALSFIFCLLGCGGGGSLPESHFANAALVGEEPLSDQFNSHTLYQAGEHSRNFFYQAIENRNQMANLPYQLLLVDARDPRLYRLGVVVQPQSPATHVVLRVYRSNRVEPAGLIQDQPGELVLKDLNGGFVFGFSYSLNKIVYKTRFHGVIGSTWRYTVGNGWLYGRYWLGFGNFIDDPTFQQNVERLLGSIILSL